jgi:hypothetical protein
VITETSSYTETEVQSGAVAKDQVRSMEQDLSACAVLVTATTLLQRWSQQQMQLVSQGPGFWAFILMQGYRSPGWRVLHRGQILTVQVSDRSGQEHSDCS